MNRVTLACGLVGILMVAPLALGEGLLPVDPIVNGNFDTYVTATVSAPGSAVLNRCFGVGHQVIYPLYSPWADDVFAAANDPATAAGALAADPAGESPRYTSYPVAHAGEYAAAPGRLYECDPQHREFAELNAWEKLGDRGFMWSNDPGTKFLDVDGDGDREAAIPGTPVQHGHSLWQSIVTPGQAFSLDADAFAFTVEAGAIPAYAQVQLGFSLSPAYRPHPWVGVFWEGAVAFPASAMTPDATGRVVLDLVRDASIVCPSPRYEPCEEFKADFGAAVAADDDVGARALLGQTRLVQTSFWHFNNAAAPVALDDVALVGAKSAAESALVR